MSMALSLVALSDLAQVWGRISGLRWSQPWKAMSCPAAHVQDSSHAVASACQLNHPLPRIRASATPLAQGEQAAAKVPAALPVEVHFDASFREALIEVAPRHSSVKLTASEACAGSRVPGFDFASAEVDNCLKHKPETVPVEQRPPRCSKHLYVNTSNVQEPGIWDCRYFSDHLEPVLSALAVLSV